MGKKNKPRKELRVTSNFRFVVKDIYGSDEIHVDITPDGPTLVMSTDTAEALAERLREWAQAINDARADNGDGE